ncbi:MAG: hypothetical protein WB902_27165 [Acetobacteraceae bacterium]
MPKPNLLFGAIVAVPMIASSHPVLCASETDWWRTTGAAVVEHRTALDEAACSLFVYNKDDAAVVTWGKTGAREISFYHSDWQFGTDQPISVAVRLGEAWLGAPAPQNPPHLMAIAVQGRLSVPVSQPVEDLLRNATRITVQLADHETSIDVDRPKMPALLAAVDRCRATLK